MSNEKDYAKNIELSSVIFIYCKNKYLFLKRASHKRIDPNKLNGVGGRLEEGENFLQGAIRETEEETGYVITPENIFFSGIIELNGGYEHNHIIGLFKAEVFDFDIPKKDTTDDGELIWIDKEEIMNFENEIVDDVKYYFKDIMEGNIINFVNAKLDDNQKVYEITMDKLTI